MTVVVVEESVARIVMFVLSHVALYHILTVTPHVFADAVVTPAFIPVIAENS